MLSDFRQLCYNGIMIKDILQKLGFNDKEIAVYLNVLEQGKAKPSDVSRMTGINRTTVYGIAKELIQKGVIVEDLAGKQSYLVALPPQDLKVLAQQEERELANKKILIDQAVEELGKYTKNTKYSIPKIQFVYEEDVEDFLYKQSPVWSKSMEERDNTWWGFNDTSTIELHQKWIDWYWKNIAPKDFQVKLLTNQSQVEKEMDELGYDRRIIKFWDGGNVLTAATWVCGDYIIMLVTGKKPHYLVQIYDETFAFNMREMFKSLWSNAK